MCFVLFEVMVALGALLALAELTSWLSVLVLPAAVAGMVKFNDVLAGLLDARPAPPSLAGVAIGRAGVAVAVVPALTPVEAAPAGGVAAGGVEAGGVTAGPAPGSPVPRKPRPGPVVGSTLHPMPRPRGSASVPSPSPPDPDAPPAWVERQVSRDLDQGMDDVRSRRQRSRQSATVRYD